MRYIGYILLSRGAWGAAMRAVRDSEPASESVGLNPVAIKTVAFAISAFCAGAAGGLFAPLSGFVTPHTFGFSQSILFVLVVMIGGAGFAFGPMIGALIVGMLPEVLSSLEEFRLLFFGAMLLVVLWVAPGGMAGLAQSLLAFIRRVVPQAFPRELINAPQVVADAAPLAQRPRKGALRAGSGHQLWRRARRRRTHVHSEAGAGDEPHRPQWRRQDDGAQHAERLLSPQSRRFPSGRGQR